MTVVNFNKLQKQEYEFLDTLDLMSIIDKDTDVYSNTKGIENLYGEKYQKYTSHFYKQLLKIICF